MTQIVHPELRPLNFLEVLKRPGIPKETGYYRRMRRPSSGIYSQPTHFFRIYENNFRRQKRMSYKYYILNLSYQEKTFP